jgi:hypothetical protein
MIGVTFKGATNFWDPESAQNPESGDQKVRRTFGLSVSRFGEGIIAFEGVALLTPGFFEGSSVFGQDLVSDSYALSATGNVILTTPRLWTEYSLRPFVSAGFGMLRVSHDDTALPVSANMLGMNVGGGAIGFLSERTGVRFEMRYHRAVGRPEFVNQTFDGGPGRLRYFTASIGLVIRSRR